MRIPNNALKNTTTKPQPQKIPTRNGTYIIFPID